jgi:hypothetical protein
LALSRPWLQSLGETVQKHRAGALAVILLELRPLLGLGLLQPGDEVVGIERVLDVEVARVADQPALLFQLGNDGCLEVPFPMRGIAIHGWISSFAS